MLLPSASLPVSLQSKTTELLVARLALSDEAGWEKQPCAHARGVAASLTPPLSAFWSERSVARGQVTSLVRQLKGSRREVCVTLFGYLSLVLFFCTDYREATTRSGLGDLIVLIEQLRGSKRHLVVASRINFSISTC